jgi:hypothetical protein
MRWRLVTKAVLLSVLAGIGTAADCATRDPVFRGFERSVIATGLPGMAIPCIARLEDNRLMSVWSTGGAAIVGAYSADSGRTWASPQTLIATNGGQNWDPNIIVSGQRVIVASTVVLTPYVSSAVFVNRSDDNGATWAYSPSAPCEVPMNHTYTSGKVGRGLRLTSGKLLMPYSWDLFDYHAGVMISTDNGITWQNGGNVHPETIPAGGGDEPHIVQFNDNSLYMLMRTITNHPYQARSFDDGATWTDVKPSPLTAYNSPAGLCLFNANGRQGMLAVWDNSDSNRYPLVAATSFDHGLTWSKPIDIAGNTGGYQASYANAVQAANGDMVVVWNQETANGWDVRSARFLIEVPEPTSAVLLMAPMVGYAAYAFRNRNHWLLRNQ